MAIPRICRGMVGPYNFGNYGLHIKHFFYLTKYASDYAKGNALFCLISAMFAKKKKTCMLLYRTQLPLWIIYLKLKSPIINNCTAIPYIFIKEALRHFC